MSEKQIVTVGSSGLYDRLKADYGGETPAPPAKIGGKPERAERPRFDWNVSLNKALGEFDRVINEIGIVGDKTIDDLKKSEFANRFTGMVQDFIDHQPHLGIKDTKKIRNIRDIAMISLAAVSDVVPMLRSTLLLANAGIVVATGTAGFVDKARQISRIKKGKITEDSVRQATLKKLGLEQADIKASESILKLAFKSFWNDSIYGKLSGANKNINLETAEKVWATVNGVGMAILTVGLSELTREFVNIPGLKTIAGRVVSRLFVQKMAPWFIIQVSSLVVRGAESLGGVEGNLEAKRQDFADVAMSSMSAAMMISMPLIMAYRGIAKGEVKGQARNGEQALATKMPTPTETVAPTLVPSFEHTPTPPPAATVTSEPPLTETPIPPATPTDFWHPGEHDLSADQLSGHEAGELRYGSETWHLWNLDADNNPDYATDADGNTVMWELANGRYAVDPDHDGIANGSYSLEELLPYFPILTPTPQSGVVDGGAKMAALQPLRQAEGSLPPPKNLDLNNSSDSEEIKVVTDNSGNERYYLDRGNNGLQLDDSGKPVGGDDVEIKITWQTIDGVDKPAVIEFPHDDGSFWQWNAELGRYQGFLADGGKLADAGGQYGNLQGKVIDEYGLVYSPKEIGAAAFRACQNNPNAEISDVLSLLKPRADNGVLGPWVKPAVAETPQPQPQSWEGMAIDAHGGAEGIIQGAIHQVNPEMDRNIAGQIAAQVAAEQKLDASGLQLNAGLTDLGHGNAGAIIEAVNRGFVRHSLMGVFQDTYHLNYQQAMEASFTASSTSSLTNAQGQIFSGEIGKPCLGAFGLSDDWEQWLRDRGYII